MGDIWLVNYAFCLNFQLITGNIDGFFKMTRVTFSLFNSFLKGKIYATKFILVCKIALVVDKYNTIIHKHKHNLHTPGTCLLNKYWCFYGIIQVGQYPRHLISLFFRLLYPWYWPSSCWNFVISCIRTIFYSLLRLIFSTWEKVSKPKTQ